MNLKTQVIGINQLLSDIYCQPMRLSYLLAELNFDKSDLARLQQYLLPDVVAIFLTTLDWVIASAETEIEQFELIRDIYGLSCDLANHLSDYASRTLKERQIQIIKQSFLSSWDTANSKSRLESELKARINQLIIAEKSYTQKQLSYTYSSADRSSSEYSLNISLSPEGEQYLTISDRHQQISIPQAELLAFYQQLSATVKLLQPSPQSHCYQEIRRIYKKAYTPWTKEEEQILIGNFNRGVSIKEIAQLLKRQPGAISSRINKLDLRS